jgi:hypothetical protein
MGKCVVIGSPGQHSWGTPDGGPLRARALVPVGGPRTDVDSVIDGRVNGHNSGIKFTGWRANTYQILIGTLHPFAE